MNPHKRLAAKHVAEAIDSLHIAAYHLSSPHCREFEEARTISQLRTELAKIRDKLIEGRSERDPIAHHRNGA